MTTELALGNLRHGSLEEGSKVRALEMRSTEETGVHGDNSHWSAHGFIAVTLAKLVFMTTTLRIRAEGPKAGVKVLLKVGVLGILCNNGFNSSVRLELLKDGIPDSFGLGGTSIITSSQKDTLHGARVDVVVSANHQR